MTTHSTFTDGPWFHERPSPDRPMHAIRAHDPVNGPVIAYMNSREDPAAIEARAAALAAAPDLLAALRAEQEWREREAAGAIDPDWDYERMVGDKRRAAIAKATRG
jgi:hypothetical protein